MAHDTQEDSECPTFVHCALESAPGLWMSQTYNECHLLLLADGNRVLGIMESTVRALCTLHAFSALGCCKAVFTNAVVPWPWVPVTGRLTEGQHEPRAIFHIHELVLPADVP